MVQTIKYTCARRAWKVTSVSYLMSPCCLNFPKLFAANPYIHVTSSNFFVRSMLVHVTVDTYRMVPYRTTTTEQCNWFKGIALNVKLVPEGHNNNSDALPQMSCFVDCCGYVQDGTLTHNQPQNNTIDLRYHFKHWFVPDAHNNDAIASHQISCFVWLLWIRTGWYPIAQQRTE